MAREPPSFLRRLLHHSMIYHSKLHHYYSIILQVAQFRPSYYKSGSHDHRFGPQVPIFFIMSSTDISSRWNQIALPSVTYLLLIQYQVLRDVNGHFELSSEGCSLPPQKHTVIFNHSDWISVTVFYFGRRLVSYLIRSGRIW